MLFENIRVVFVFNFWEIKNGGQYQWVGGQS